MDLYFERYPGVLDYMERTRAQAKEQGYVETLEDQAEVNRLRAAALFITDAF
jgi:DNA polymerase I-like protein with 3'-5' exonuclease and polymerase domains